jgi:ribosomal protein S18 acetylase RimI-like enzyme
VEIRPFENDDEPAVVALWERCRLTRPWNDPHEDIARKRSLQPHLFLVGLVEREIVASVMAGYEGHRGWLNYVAIDPVWQRRGLGREIVQAAERLLREQGCPKINLLVRGGNDAAVSFYRSLGYDVDDVISLGKRLHDAVHPPRDFSQGRAD